VAYNSVFKITITDVTNDDVKYFRNVKIFGACHRSKYKSISILNIKARQNANYDT
jgi:hypothetical protein